MTNENENFADDERGVATVEYVIILWLIAMVGMAAWEQFGSQMQGQIFTLADIIRNLR